LHLRVANSELGVRGWVMGSRERLLSTTILSGLVGIYIVAASSASAGDLSAGYLKAPPPAVFEPAVDAFNTKAEGFGGSINGKSVYGGAGALTVPLSSQYGAQIDGVVGGLDGSTFGAVAGHLFWRNPSQALVGIYGSYTEWDRFGGVQVGQVAGEFELFYGRFTVQGLLGVEFGNTVSSANNTPISNPIFGGGVVIGSLNSTFTTTQTFSIGTRFFDQINLKYYFNDYFDAYVGHRYLGGKNMAAFGGEAALPLGRGVLGSAFVEGRVGESDTRSIVGGVKLYFGPTDKSLIARHRKEDPNLWGLDTIFTILNSVSPGTSATPTTQSCNHGVEIGTGKCKPGT
jgi:hypothetical protein